MGRIAVGPESAGADPGPACYGLGGTHPAVTDANLLLGRYDSSRFAGGTMRLDEAAARTAMTGHVAGALGLDAELAALGVVEMVDENMANAARVHAIESGKSYEGRTLIAFGGGGPVHACRVAEKIGINRVLVPSGAGVGSAIGFLRAPVGYEVVRSLYQRFSTFDVAAVNDLLGDMRQEAEAAVAKGSFGAPTAETRTVYMRYVGQGHEIPVPLPNRVLGGEDIALIRARYDEEYARFFDRPVPGSDVEIMSYAVVVTTVTDGVTVPIGAESLRSTKAVPVRTQMVRDTTTGAVSPWQVYDRASLVPDATIVGPAIVAEDETSTLIGPSWTATINGLGYIEMTRSL
jgi:N-methylhydantoinase A